VANELTSEITEVVKANCFACSRHTRIRLRQQLLCGNDATLDNPSRNGRSGYTRDCVCEVTRRIPERPSDIPETYRISVVSVDVCDHAIGKAVFVRARAIGKHTRCNSLLEIVTAREERVRLDASETAFAPPARFRTVSRTVAPGGQDGCRRERKDFAGVAFEQGRPLSTRWGSMKRAR
jgi:hypothetical protein